MILVRPARIFDAPRRRDGD